MTLLRGLHVGITVTLGIRLLSVHWDDIDCSVLISCKLKLHSVLVRLIKRMLHLLANLCPVTFQVYMCILYNISVSGDLLHDQANILILNTQCLPASWDLIVANYSSKVWWTQE